MSNFGKHLVLTLGLIASLGLYASEKVVATTNIVEGVPTRATVVSCQMRATDPSVLDVVYNVESKEPYVKVRALAFKDGKRDFGHVIRPETWVDGTETNLGDHIAANVNHKLSWKVTADWQTDVGNLSFEIFSMSAATNVFVLPYQVRRETRTGEMQYYVLAPQVECSWGVFSWDYVYESGSRDSVRIDALLWFFADKDKSLVLDNGCLSWGGKPLADATGFVLESYRDLYDPLGYLGCHDGEKVIYGEFKRVVMSGTGDEYIYFNREQGEYAYSGRLMFNQYIKSKFVEFKDVAWKTWPARFEVWD